MDAGNVTINDDTQERPNEKTSVVMAAGGRKKRMQRRSVPQKQGTVSSGSTTISDNSVESKSAEDPESLDLRHKDRIIVKETSSK